MDSRLEQSVYFMPLFFNPKQWLSDLDRLDQINVKVITVPRDQDSVDITMADVFSVSGYMPPEPATEEHRTNLIEAVRKATEDRTGKTVGSFNWDIVIWTPAPTL